MIRARPGCLVVFLWTFALAWNGILAVILAIFFFRVGFPRGVGALAYLGFMALFVAAGIYVLRLAIRATASASRFRGAAVELRSATVGGKVEGTVHLPEGDGPLELHLRCWQQYGGDTSDDLLWETAQPAGAGHPGAGGMLALPFSFDVPPHCRPTSDGIAWKLEIEDAAGRSVSFEIPVASELLQPGA
ncbi:MAG TPA: hypothetical protein VJ276_01980 [Thermoanaerobaculia bacterium]|nr:hypothetical protein [Thermoanaerobaculia bacterium]